MVGTLLLLLLVGGSTPLLLRLLLLRGGCITPPAVFVSPELLFSCPSLVGQVISTDCWCQNVPLSITNMFVIDHKENVSLIIHKIVCD